MPINPFLFGQIKVPEGITISERFGDKLKAKIKPLHILNMQCKCIKNVCASDIANAIRQP